jgi:dihydrofolate reductase
MIISHIVAASENNAIGVKNGLPWNIPEDLKFFKDKTLNSIMIMGRKTYESIGRPLPKRVTIVVSKTSKPGDYPEGVLLAESIEAAIEIAKKVALDKNKQEIFIVGGGEIYKQSLNLVDKVYLTKIHLRVEADAYYPEILDKDFKMVLERPAKDDNYSYTFYEYIRKS